MLRIKWNEGGAHFIAVKYENNKYYAFNSKKAYNGKGEATNLKEFENMFAGKITSGIAVK